MSGSGSLQAVVAIIQARFASSRLPGKVLLDVGGRPMLQHVVERARRIPSVGRVLVATTTQTVDDAVARFCSQADIEVFRGHATDVLDRYYWAAKEAEAGVIVRLTGDCPLLDPGVSEQTIQLLLQGMPELDFTANRLPDHRTYPIGLDTEVCTRQALELAWSRADQPHQREHVMPYIYEHPKEFKIKLLDSEVDRSHMRWTVDTAEDLDFVREVFASFSPSPDFGWEAVLELLERKPELSQINASVRHRDLQEVDRRFSTARTAGEQD